KFIKCLREDPRLKDISITMVSAALTEESPDLDKIGANFYLYKGPAHEIKQNIIKVLRQLENKDKSGKEACAILGIDGMYQRAVVKELISSQRHQEVVLENMGEAVIEADASFRVTYINPAGVKIINKTEGQIIGSNVYDLFTNESYLKMSEAVNNLSLTPDARVTVLTLPYGKLILRVIIAKLIEKGENTGMILIAEDVTDYHSKVRELTLANEKLRKMQDKLIQDAKFSMLGQLSANITREIENPLVSALSYISLLLRGEIKDEVIEQKLTVIQEEIQRARSIIRDLIDFGEEERSELERIEVGETLRRTVALVRHRADSLDITIIERYDKKLPVIFADANKLKQVFINLINNAFEAMPGGGALTIASSVTKDDSLSDSGTNDIIQIAFADNGVGISPEFLPKIFNPFFSAKPERNTTGLGLSTSLKVIQDLGGTIAVESKVGVGSTFTIKIPIRREDISA
ncbi:MAG: ATP-binding protein, partial [Pseudomonadota bacterium]